MTQTIEHRPAVSRSIARIAPTLEKRAGKYWFATASRASLGFCRMLFFALMFWFYRGSDYITWADLPASMINNRIFAFRALHLGVASHDTLAMLQFVWKVSLLTGCIGFFTRISVWTAAILSFYMFGVPGNFGKMGHGEGILVITMFILALSRCAGAWTVDQLRHAWTVRDPNESAKPPRGEYRWPTRMIWLLTSLVFFAAGVTKLRLSGLDWITTDNLSRTILQHYYGGYGDPPMRLGVWIAEHRALCKAIAGLTIFIEVAFPLAMFSRWARWTLVPAMFLAQVGIYVMMGVAFTQFMFVYLFWVPWEKIGDRIRAIAQRRGRYVMLYDGGCGICRSVAAVARHLDILSRVEFLDVLNDWPKVHARFGQLDQQECLSDIHMIAPDGRVMTRYVAYRETAWAIPAAWIFLPLLYVPPVPQIGDRIYGYVAVHRHDAGCEVSP